MLTGFQIVETDNHGSDYPNEKFISLPLFSTFEKAQAVTDMINQNFCTSDDDNRFWKVVPYGYKLRPGFEP
jgi:hypothetical protein